MNELPGPFFSKELWPRNQKSASTDQSITKLISQSSEPHREAGGKIDVLADIANDFKLVNKKGPAVNQHLAKIVQGLTSEKLSEEVLTKTQNRYNRPENGECLSTTKANHLIWDKLKPETRSNDIKLQRVQCTLVKGVTPMVSIVEKLLEAKDKVPKGDALDVPGLTRGVTDAIALIGAANFELNMRRRENIKPELNEDYKHLCSSSVTITKSLFGEDSELSKQRKDLAEATKVSKKLSRGDPKMDGHKHQGFSISITPSLKDLDTNTEVKRRTQISSSNGKGMAPHTTSTIKRGGGKANGAKKNPLQR